MSKTITITAGIDTSKHKLDVAVHGQAGTWTVKNDQSGWEQLAEQLRCAGVTRIGIEATGSYERGVTRHLQAAGFTVVVLDPRQVKAFAQLRRQRAKTDPIDAGLIAACTVMLDATNSKDPDIRFDKLTDHLTFIEQQEEDIKRFKTRLEHITDDRLRDEVKADITRLEQRRKAELQLLTASLKDHPDLLARLKLVESVPGIGTRTALAIVLRLPELDTLSREEVASLAGLAPFVRQSGGRVGEAHIGGGRSRLRQSLYAAALPASFRWNPALVSLYQRLTARGKPHKVALIACARKLLIYAATVVQRGTPWEARATTI